MNQGLACVGTAERTVTRAPSGPSRRPRWVAVPGVPESGSRGRPETSRWQRPASLTWCRWSGEEEVPGETLEPPSPSCPSLCPLSPGGRREASVHFLQEGLQPELLLKAGGWGDLQRVQCGREQM